MLCCQRAMERCFAYVVSISSISTMHDTSVDPSPVLVVSDDSTLGKTAHDHHTCFVYEGTTAFSLLLSYSILLLRLLSTTQQTSPPGGDETGLLTLCGEAGDGRCFTNMLVVTTTVRLE